MDETSNQRSAFSGVVSALGRQLKELASAALPAPPAPMTTPWRAIKPRGHEKVAIDVHRDDWP